MLAMMVVVVAVGVMMMAVVSHSSSHWGQLSWR